MDKHAHTQVTHTHIYIYMHIYIYIYWDKMTEIDGRLWTGAWMDRSKDNWTIGYIDGRVGGCWMDRWLDRKTCI